MTQIEKTARKANRVAKTSSVATMARCPEEPASVLSGTIFYWRVEDWTIVQSLYFCIVTLTTVGFGDLAPTSSGAQIFTIFYILTGIGVFVALLASVAQQYIAQKSETPSARERLNARRQRHQGE